MQTNDHKTRDYSAVLEARFGKEGSPEREKAIDEARAFYTGQILHDARKEVRMTQSQLAEKVSVTKSYISRVENGGIIPSVSMFYRIIDALGLRIELVRPMGTL